MIKNNIYLKNFQKKEKSKKRNQELKKKFDHVFAQILKDKKKPSNIFYNLSNNYTFSFSISDLKKFKKFSFYVVIGMGGSILGAEAIHQFMEHRIKKNFYFINDLDENNILKIKKNLNLKKTLFIIVSKSGNTVETISNFLRFNILKKKTKNIIVISEKKNNSLYFLTKKFNLDFIEHKNYIGGRYSVLSEVGMVPAYLMGLDILKFRKNSDKYLIKNKIKTLKESTIEIANILKNNKCPTLIFLNYSPRLEKFLFWSQQLIAESLGKKGIGFLPVISNVPKDHHSLLQLYLDGPKNKIFHIFSMFEENKSKKLNSKNLTKQIKYLNNKSLDQIKYSQKNALIQVFKKNKIPFKETIVKKINEETLGELFSYFMVETAIVGKLSNINPFNQPAVEQVKILTKKLLN